MVKQYKALMEQQNVDAEVTAEFYEKLNKTETQRKPIRWKVALIAACLALMIPLSAFAIEYIFGAPQVKIGEVSYFPGMDGVSVRFDNINNYPLDAFPKEKQMLTEDMWISFDSWEAAEEDLGIDLLNNTVLANAEKRKFWSLGVGDAHCISSYRLLDGQLCHTGLEAVYRYENLAFNLQAGITVEHPQLDEETKQLLHGLTFAFEDDAEITYEDYTTREGIPVVIVRSQSENFLEYDAAFAVNDISYKIRFYGNLDSEEVERQILRDLLDGFELN